MRDLLCLAVFYLEVLWRISEMDMGLGHIFIWNKTFQLILSISFDWFHVQHITQTQPNLQHWRFVALFKIFRKYLTLFPWKSLSFSIWYFNWNLILQLSARFSNERLENLDKFFEIRFLLNIKTPKRTVENSFTTFSFVRMTLIKKPYVPDPAKWDWGFLTQREITLSRSSFSKYFS